jgi:hypothetical protein
MKRVLLVVAVMVVAALAYVVSRPATFRVSRMAVVPAPPDVVYGQVVDFNRWPAWSPWEGKDPAMKRSYEGAAGTVGASYGWASQNEEVGTGKMTVTGLEPNQRLVIKLDFKEPFESTSTVTFSFKPMMLVPGSTQVLWSMEGGGGLSGKLMNAFMNPDQAVGPDFQQGLMNLTRVSDAEWQRVRAERAAAAAAAVVPAGEPGAQPADAGQP